MDTLIEDKAKSVSNNSITRVIGNPQNSQYFSEAELKDRREGNDDQRFWSLLSDIKRKANLSFTENAPIQILDIACGECKESNLLLNFFKGEGSGKANLIGIDINQDRINKAKELNLDNQDATFLCGDATKLDQDPGIPSKINIIMIRSQEISADTQIWTEIFKQGLKKLADNGFMILTSYSEEEHQMLKDAVKDLPFQAVLDETNCHSKISDSSGGQSGKDMKVLVVKTLSK